LKAPLSFTALNPLNEILHNSKMALEILSLPNVPWEKGDNEDAIKGESDDV